MCWTFLSIQIHIMSRPYPEDAEGIKILEYFHFFQIQALQLFDAFLLLQKTPLYKFFM